MSEGSQLIAASHLAEVERLLWERVPSGRLQWWPLRRDGSRAVQAFRFEHEGELQLGYLKRYEDPERALEVLEKQRALDRQKTPFGPGVRPLDGAGTLLYLAPRDAGLRFLGQVIRIDKLKRLVAELPAFAGFRVRGRRSGFELMAYKPEHRLHGRLRLALIDDATGEKSRHELFLRLFADDRGRELSRLATALREAGFEDAIPRQYGLLGEGRVQLEEFREGDELFAEGRTIPAEPLAKLVARLGACDSIALPFVSLERLVEERLAAVSAPAGSRLRAPLRALAQRLQAALPDPGTQPRGVTHGDLHPRQFLVGETMLSLVDLERCHLSHPAVDPGHFLAELQLRELEFPERESEIARFAREFRAAWCAARSDIDPRLLDLTTALGFVAAASRAQRRGAHASTEDQVLLHLRQALETMGKGEAGITSETAEWTHLYPHRRRPWSARGVDAQGKERAALYDPVTRVLRLLDETEDRRLPGLAPSLSEGRLISWRAGRRAVVQLENGAYRKIIPPKRVPPAVGRLEWLQRVAEGRDLIVPRLLAHDARRGTLDLERVSGRPLLDLLREDDLDALDAVGRGVAALHGLPCEESLAEAGPDDLGAWRDHVAEVFTSEGAPFDAALAALPQPATQAIVPLHGDLHEKNLLVADGRCAFIDVEGMRRGPAARDLGNLMAHFQLRGWQEGRSEDDARSRGLRFLNAYEAAGGAVNEAEVQAERRRALFRLACVYSFRKAWRSLVPELLRASGALLLLALLLLPGCVALVVEAPPETGEDGKPRLGSSYLAKDQTVEVRGHFEGDAFKAEHIEIEGEDDEVELKSTLEAVEGAKITVGEMHFALKEDSRLLDRDGRELTPEELGRSVSAFCKAEAIERAGTFQLRKLTLRDRKEGEKDQLQGKLEDLRNESFRIGEALVRFDRNVPIFWDVKGVAAPDAQDRGLRSRSDPRLAAILRVDDDDIRSGSGFRLAEWVGLSGEIQWDMEWRYNHNLRREKPRDRLIHELGTTLEFSFNLGERAFAFTKLNFEYDWAIFDEREGDRHGGNMGIQEAYVVLLDFPFEGAVLEFGRQKFDQGREWMMDDEIDGVRLFLNLEPALLEFSVSHLLLDADPEEEDVTNFLFGAHLEPLEASRLFAYALYRSGGKRVDLERWHGGFSYEQGLEQLNFWLDVAYTIGREDDLEVEGWGIDGLLAYMPEGVGWNPSFYVGFAYGSGDNDHSDGKDSSFRQTGLQDNNDKINGVTGFRYLGELVRPDLSNLLVTTIGFGFRPTRRTSVDFVVHHYTQVEASKVLRDTRLRLDPKGHDEDIGTELDLIVGIGDWRPFEFEIVFAWFEPGAAFEEFQEGAWFMTFQAEWNF